MPVKLPGPSLCLSTAHVSAMSRGAAAPHRTWSGVSSGSRMMSCIKRTALILRQATEPFQHFLCFSLSMKGNGHRNQKKQNELAGHSMQGFEGFLSLLRKITSCKIWLESTIQLINNLSSFLIIQITGVLSAACGRQIKFSPPASLWPKSSTICNAHFFSELYSGF